LRDIQGGSDLGDIFAGSIPDVIGKPVYPLRYPAICSATYPTTFPLTGGTPGMPKSSLCAGKNILVYFLALTMWRTLQQWMKASGLGTAPRKLLEKLLELKSLDVLLPSREKKLRPRMVAT
jgi:hypothetical protein